MGTANFITLLRIVGTGMLLFTKPFTYAFYLLYTLCGITDVLDGAIARATKTTSALGAKLDSTADLMFYGVMFWKLAPLPYFMAQPFFAVYGWVTAITAWAASMEELAIHLSSKVYHPNINGIWKHARKKETSL